MDIQNDVLTGYFIILLASIEGFIVFFSPGSFRFHKPSGGINAWAYNIVHLFYEFIVIPFVGIMLIFSPDWTLPIVRVTVPESFLFVARSTGIIFLLAGSFLHSWGRISLGRSFKLGCVAPADDDKLIINGPYRYIRNPMYTAVLCRCLGHTLIVPSIAILFIFFCLLFLIILIIPEEEKNLRSVYGKRYAEYMNSVKKMIPFLY
jgi:protein-S-isoprenylcysteine O-methyltransferase Ste14